MVVVVSLVGSLVSCTLVAYPLARMRFKGRDAMFILVVATLMLPAQVLLLPRYLLFNTFGWIDTLLPLTVPAYFGLNAFYVFFLRQYFRSIPRELGEAMLVDGASRWTILRRLIVPLSMPAFAVIAVIHIVGTYNDFFDPFIYLHSSENLTLAVGIATVNQIIPGVRSVPKEMAGVVLFVAAADRPLPAHASPDHRRGPGGGGDQGMTGDRSLSEPPTRPTTGDPGVRGPLSCTATTRQLGTHPA